MKIGIDLGRTIVTREEFYPPFDGAFETIARMVKYFGQENIFIVSRVNSEQRERALKWLSSNDFYNKTGFLRKNLYFCFERQDKAIFVKALGIDIFIDDRPDVLSEMEGNVDKILFNPSEEDLIKYKEIIHFNNMLIVYNWEEINEYIF